jgi:ferredoxin
VKIVIDKERCTGHGRCYLLAPGLFLDDERGYGQVEADKDLDEADLAEADKAIQGCPERAISLY